MKSESKYLNFLLIAVFAVLMSGLSGLHEDAAHDTRLGLYEQNTRLNTGPEACGLTASANHDLAALQSPQDKNSNPDRDSFLGCLSEIEDSEKQHLCSLLSTASFHHFYVPIQPPPFVSNSLPFFKLNIILPRLRTVVLLH